MAGRKKIIGNKKCPRRYCNKLGRYNPKPKVSWNTKLDKEKKRFYFQFIHNDGTRHNLGIAEEPFPLLIQSIDHLRKLSDAARAPDWKWKDDKEEGYLLDCLHKGDFGPINRKYRQYKRDRAREVWREPYQRSNDIDTQEKEQIDELTVSVFNATAKIIDEAIYLEELHPHEDPKTMLTKAIKNVLDLKEEEKFGTEHVTKIFERRVEQLQELDRRLADKLAELKVKQIEVNKRKRQKLTIH